MAVTPIPSKAAYQTAVQLWHDRAHTYRDSGAVGWLANTTGHQYDAQFGCYYCRDISGNSSWDAKITRAWQEYNYYENTFAVPAGQIATYLMHLDGYLEDYKRSVGRSPTSVTNVNSILTQAPYMIGDGGDPLDTIPYSREVAYVLRAHTIARQVGITLTGAQVTRETLMYNRCMAHCDIWIAKTHYCRTFMAALTARSLIDYCRYVDSSKTTAVKNKLIALGDFIRTDCWEVSAGAWGVGQAFRYQDVVGGGETDTNTAPDLNAVICPIYAWLWYQTGLTQYITWHDEAFVAGIPVYSGDTQISGAYQGTAALPALKQINQQTYWAPEGIYYRELEPLTGGSTVATFAIASPIKEAKLAGAGIQDFVLTLVAATANTIYTPAANRYAVLVGIQYANAAAHTLNFISGSTTLCAFDMPANGGLSKEVSKNPIFIGRLGEAIKLQSSANVTAVLCYVMEVEKIPLGA